MSTKVTLKTENPTLRSTLLDTLNILQSHLTTTRESHAESIKALTSAYEDLFSQACATTSADLAEQILHGSMHKLSNLIRNEVYAFGRWEEDTLVTIEMLEGEIEAAGEAERGELDGCSSEIWYTAECGHGYGDEHGLLCSNEDIVIEEGITQIWDGERYRIMYDFGAVMEEVEALEFMCILGSSSVIIVQVMARVRTTQHHIS
ncbi:hypothetical protein L873DRAFT_1841061 [Choiromyces venosus 120613-1]|uniref:Uncharacterized protein n=1 Tax=Choiromyces venosus 120613-1 TaxID=1336337 RepID=A0A3N4K3X5_9PEZI|nr:hypothetical protein L873DRAFT_1841061 [Choiromyces venosus 120613-1]